MRFRNYTATDIEAMLALDALCFTEPFQFDRQTMQQFAQEAGAIVVLVDDCSDAGDCPDAEHPAGLIAFMILHLEVELNETSAYIVTIDVSPNHRRRGIGGGMLDRAEAAARAAGGAHVSLHVAADNVDAITFYESQQYRRMGRVRRFYREAGQDAILFARPLERSATKLAARSSNRR